MAHILPAQHQCAACGQPLPRFTTIQATTQPDPPPGWSCPGCGHSYAPWVPQCHHCPVPAGSDPGPIEVGR